MKNTTTKQITLRNFKGEKNRVVEFGNITQIYGDNKTGKTTIADAYNWILFDKDSKGDSVFDIKTLDSNGEPIHKLEHEVESILDDGTKLRKCYKEKWTKKRGESEEQLTGHTTDYWINDVPKSKSEYESKVSEMLNSDIARLISDTKYFNEILDWKQRREIIASMAETPTVEDISINSTEQLQDVVNLVNQGKDIEEEKKRVSAQKKLSKDELKTIDPKIEEVNRMMPETLDWELIELNIIKSGGALMDVNESINDASKAYQLQANANAELIKSKANKQTEYSQLDTTLRDTPNAELDAYYATLNTKKEELSELNTQHTEKVRERNGVSSKIAMSETDRNTLLADFYKIRDSKFVQDSTSCPTCKREYDNSQSNQSELLANFNTDKANKLKINGEDGSAKASELLNLKVDLHRLEKEIISLKSSIETKQLLEINTLIKPTAEHKPTPEMITLKSEIDLIVIPEIVKVDVSELEAKKVIIQEEIDAQKAKLTSRDTAKQLKERIEELTNQKRVLSQQIADFEKLEFQIETYQNSEMDLIEQRVNDKFSIVKFKMFEKQMNGGIKQTCVAMVDGVPYKSVNTAGQIQASLDIINTIQCHYQTFAPVFIDNAEGINDIPKMQCQTVQLIVEKTQLQQDIDSLKRLIAKNPKSLEMIAELESLIEQQKKAPKELRILTLDQ